MTARPIMRHISKTAEQVAADGCFLRELLHPERAGSPVGYSLAYAYVLPDGRTVEHVLEQSEVYYGLAGQGTLVIDGLPYPLATGTCICVPPHSKQYLINVGGERLEFLCIVDPPWRADGETLTSRHNTADV